MASSTLRKAIRPLVLNPPSGVSPTASLIFAHGFGATHHDWAMLDDLPSVKEYIRVILPQAPMQPITVSGGYSSPAWYDILRPATAGREKEGDEDEAGLYDSFDTLTSLVEAEMASGIPRERIVVGGFSQGAALGLLWNLTRKQEERVGGCVVLSGYAPLKWKLLKLKEEAANDLPTLWCHGTDDGVIPIATPQAAKDLLSQAGMTNIEWHAYEGMQHSASAEELWDLEEWLRRVVPPLSPQGSNGEDKSGAKL